MTLIQKNHTPKNYKHVSNPLICGNKILLLNASSDFIYSGQGNNPKLIKELFTKMLVSLDMGACIKKL